MGKELARHRVLKANVEHLFDVLVGHSGIISRSCSCQISYLIALDPEVAFLLVPLSFTAAFQLANSLGTVSHSYQAMLGIFLTSKFPDTGQGPAFVDRSSQVSQWM